MRLRPIPPMFYRESENNPFDACLVCGKHFERDTLYVVEKAFQTYQPYSSRDLVFEYAMCIDCYQEFSASMSDDSRAAMDEYMQGRVDFDEREEALMNDPDPDTSRWTSSCLVSGKPIQELDGYQAVGLFMGNWMIVSHLPCVIGSDVIGEIVDKLSNKTIDMLSGFVDEHFPKPPGYEKDIPRPVLVA